jgi:hypothetical protein
MCSVVWTACRTLTPKAVRVFRVADRDVAAHAFGVSFACEHPEGERHFLQHPLSVLGVGREGWDARETLTL